MILLWLHGCSYVQLYIGTLPGSGATGVDPQAEIRIAITIDPDTPALGDRFTLHNDDEPVDTTVRVEAGAIVLVPRDPLPDGEYRVTGSMIDDHQGANGHYATGLDVGRAGEPIADTTFEVGGTPRVLGVTNRGDAILLAFSEEVDRSTLEGQVFYGETAVEIRGGPGPEVVELMVTNVANLASFTMAPGVRSARGPAFEPGPDGMVWSADPCQVERLLGESTGCF